MADGLCTRCGACVGLGSGRVVFEDREGRYLPRVLGELSEAEARRILLISLPPDSWQVAAAANTEGAALLGLGKYELAEPLLRDSLPSLANAPIPDIYRKAKQRLVNLYVGWGKPEEAVKARQALLADN